MSDYTPDTDGVRNVFMDGNSAWGEPEDLSRAQFDRWLEAHDREVAAKAVLELNRSLTSAINSAWVSDRGVINRIIEILDETL